MGAEVLPRVGWERQIYEASAWGHAEKWLSLGFGKGRVLAPYNNSLLAFPAALGMNSAPY